MRTLSPAGPPLAGFSDATRAWFTAAFAEPTPAQAQAWASIAQGENTLVVAPTGSGKTLAAFLWAIDKLITEPVPDDPMARCRVLYISPLKALAVDVERNLRSPLIGVSHALRRLGQAEPQVRVGVRTGDTAGDERRKLAAKPPDILITTPESLFLLLTSKARDGLRGVQTVIIDEVHALAGSKRGAHLAVSLERLDALRRAADPAEEPATRRRPVQRIGLSATVRPPEEVASFLGGAQPVTIVQPPSEKLLDVQIVVPVEDMADLESATPPGSPLPGSLPPPAGSGSAGSGSAGSTSAAPRPGSRPGDWPGRWPAGAGPGGKPGAGPPAAELEPDFFDPSPDPVPRHSIWPHVEERVLDLIESHKSTIIFANSRRLSERLCARLNELSAERLQAAADGELDGLWQTPQEAGRPARPAGDAKAGNSDHGSPPAEVMAQAGSAAGAPAEVARAHHGSVSRQERTQIEEALKAGRLPAVVATSSLELGIDMGAVDLVIQVESPPSVASGLQRTGRAGHNVGDVSRGVIFPKYQADLVQATVVAERMRSGEIEELRMPRNPLDVLAQQIVAMTAMDDWEVSEVERVVRRAAPFSGLTRPVLEAVLDMLAGRYPSEDFAGLRPRLVWDRTTGMLHGRPGSQRLAVVDGGTIPDRGMFGVFLAGGQRDRTGRHSRRVGELDEEMVYESRVGDVFVLGASSWRIEDITADQVLVSPAPGQPGKLPFWHGDAPGRPAELGAAIGAYLRGLGGLDEQQAITRLRDGGLDELAAGNLISYLASQRDATGYVPDDRTLVLERFRDELGDWRLVLHSPYGAQVHAPWALAIAARLRERYGGMDVQALHTDDGIVIRVPDADEPPPGAIAVLDAEEVEQLVTAELGASALFAARFRECAARALLLPRRQPGRRAPLWQQRQRSAQLLAVASQFATFPIVLETVRECLQDVFDVPGLTRLMRDLAARRVRLVEVETPAPSPFGRSLLFRYVGAFMYEGDAPLAERRAQALALDSALLAELLGQADARELLDPEIIRDTERDLQYLSPARAAGSAERVADMLRAIGPLSAQEVAERCTAPDAAAGWLADLAVQRRVIEVRVAGEPRWASIEDAGRLRDALGAALPTGIPEAFTEPLPDPLGDLVARYGRTHGPFTAMAAAQRYGLGVAVLAGTLRRLTAEGRLAEGEFRPGGQGTEWCDASILRLLRRRCLAKLRKEVEPVPPRALAAFLPGWQHLSGREQRRRAGPDLVYDVIEQLAGTPVPASALETLVLPGRLPGYTPAMLDELTAAGEVAWAGAGGLPGSDGWLVLAPAGTAPLLFPEPGEITMTPVHETVLAALDGGGALFFRALADRVAARLAADGAAAHGAAAHGAAAHGAAAATDQAVAAAIWDLVWAGRLTNDTLAPLRVVLGGGRPAAPRGGTGGTVGGGAGTAPAIPPPTGMRRPGRYGRRYGRAVLPSRSGPPTVSGRWSLLPPSEPDRTRRLHAVALNLLERHGIVLRGAVTAERVPGGFGALYPVLRAMEESGQCRRGYFVEGLGAAQFALPGAVDRMRSIAAELPGGDALADPGGGASDGRASGRASGGGDGTGWNGTGRPGYGRDDGSGRDGSGRDGSGRDEKSWDGTVLVLAAADPANAYGAALPWPARPEDTPGGHRPGRKAGALVVLVRGELVLYVERGGKTLLSWTSDPQALDPAAAALAAAVRAGALGRLTVERADGAGVYDSPLARALEEAGFRPTLRGLRLRG
ncbi:MAG: DEAD/DEAH box helicase [Streptosporangiaceae bacterium]